MSAATVEAQQAESERHRRGNIFGAASAVFATTFGAFMALPLLPVFLHNDLGLTDTREIAFWSGFATSMGPLASAVVGPFWGMAADRFGRRGMLVRAVLAAGGFTGALALAQAPTQVAVLRAFSGATSGVGPGAIALLAAEVPRERLGSALGAITTARALGQSVGPAIGGVLGSFLPLRIVFALGGVVIAFGVIPVVAKVHETTRIADASARPPIRRVLRELSRDTRSAIAVLIGVPALAQFALAGAQQLLLVHIIEVDPAGASLASGLAFAAISLATALAGTTYGRLVRGRGYLRVAIVAAAAMAVAIAAESLIVAVPAMIACAAFLGLGYGAHMPATSSMLGLETPNAVKGTIFGFGSSAQAFGSAGGAFFGGVLGATIGPAAGLQVLASAAVVSALVLAFTGREPE